MFEAALELTTAASGVGSATVRVSAPGLWPLASFIASVNFSVKAWLTLSGTANRESSSIRS